MVHAVHVVEGLLAIVGVLALMRGLHNVLEYRRMVQGPWDDRLAQREEDE